MSRDFRLYLDDIRDSAEKVLRYTRDLDFDRFVNDDKTFDAVVRNWRSSAKQPNTFRKMSAIGIQKLNSAGSLACATL